MIHLTPPKMREFDSINQGLKRRCARRDKVHAPQQFPTGGRRTDRDVCQRLNMQNRLLQENPNRITEAPSGDECFQKLGRGCRGFRVVSFFRYLLLHSSPAIPPDVAEAKRKPEEHENGHTDEKPNAHGR